MDGLISAKISEFRHHNREGLKQLKSQPLKENEFVLKLGLGVFTHAC